MNSFTVRSCSVLRQNFIYYNCVNVGGGGGGGHGNAAHCFATSITKNNCINYHLSRRLISKGLVKWKQEV